MIAASAVLAIVMALPQCWGEPREPDRLRVIGEAVAAVSTTADDAAGLLTIAEHESALCRSVHSGARRGGAGLGLWQLEPGSNREPPFAGLTLQDTKLAAGEALWLWRHSWQCGSGARERFTAYAGVPCATQWRGAVKRAALFGWALQRLKASGVE